MRLCKQLLSEAAPNVTFNDDEVVQLYCQKNQDTTFSIDTRTLQQGEFFVAIKGVNVDGHDFVAAAVTAGAGGLVIQHSDCLSALDGAWLKKHPVILVQDTYKFLIDLAKSWRARLAIPVVGITGSVGKTTTKEMVRSIAQHANKKAFVSWKNENTDLGLSLNVLRTSLNHEYAVYEMGINEVGEMSQLVAIARPSIGVITSVSYAHGEGLGSLTNVAQEKRKIFSLFNEQDIGVIAGDQKILTDVSYMHPVAKFGTKTTNQVQARKIRVIEKGDDLVTLFTLKWFNQRADIELCTNHIGLVSNALAASTVAYLLGLSLSSVVNGLQAYRGFEGRFELKPLHGVRGNIISDCYNANPESMKAALIAFDQLPKKSKKVAVLGDMLELGERERYWHRQVGRLLRKFSSIDTVILVGQRSKDALTTVPSWLDVVHVKDWQEAINGLKPHIVDGALILVKGSFGTQLRHVVNEFT